MGRLQLLCAMFVVGQSALGQSSGLGTGMGLGKIGWGTSQTGMGFGQTGMGIGQTKMGIGQTGMGISQTGMGIGQSGMGIGSNTSTFGAGSSPMFAGTWLYESPPYSDHMSIITQVHSLGDDHWWAALWEPLLQSKGNDLIIATLLVSLCY